MHESRWASLVHFESTFDRWRPGASSARLEGRPRQGGILLDLGTHLVDQALALFGEPESIGAEVWRERDGEGANDSFTIRLHYLTGFTVNTRRQLPLVARRVRASTCAAPKETTGSGDSTRRKTRSARSRASIHPTGATSRTDHWGTLSVESMDGSLTQPS